MVGRHIRRQVRVAGRRAERTGRISFKEIRGCDCQACARVRKRLLDYVGIGKFADYKAAHPELWRPMRRLEIARPWQPTRNSLRWTNPPLGMNATEKVQPSAGPACIDRIRSIRTHHLAHRGWS